jgi:hypothetical protein
VAQARFVVEFEDGFGGDISRQHLQGGPASLEAVGNDVSLDAVARLENECLLDARFPE